jgi:MoaA/NifB/PqqE/SkfB family radical SAM enzyme
MPFNFAFVLPTTQCLAHCEHCFYETGHSERVASVDFLEPLSRALDAMVEAGLQQMIISGGEPLLAPHLEQLLQRVGGRVPHLLMLSHGELLDEEKLALLERHQVHDITISAVEADEQLRDTVHRIMFHSRYTPTLLTTITRAHVDRVPALLEFSTRRNLPHLFTPVYVPRDADCFERASLHRLDAAAWDRLAETLRGWADQTGSVFYLAMIRDFYAGMPVHPGFCPMGTDGLVIDADGTVYPCFHRHDLAAGNLVTDPWETIAARLDRAGDELYGAPCFGEHCLSMFAGIRE